MIDRNSIGTRLDYGKNFFPRFPHHYTLELLSTQNFLDGRSDEVVIGVFLEDGPAFRVNVNSDFSKGVIGAMGDSMGTGRSFRPYDTRWSGPRTSCL